MEKPSDVFFPSTGDSIPAVNRTSYPACRPADPSTVYSDSNLSVAAVHHDAEDFDVRLREGVDLKPRHEALGVAFTDRPPAHDSVVVEPLIMSELEVVESSCSSVFEKIIVTRALATWHAADGSVAVQIANTSSYMVALPINLCLGQSYTVSVETPDQLHVNAVAKSPTSVDELAQAKSEIQGPLSKAFTNTKLTPDLKVSVPGLCAWYRPVFTLSMSELGRCHNSEATFPLLLTPVLSIVPCTVPTLELKLSLINVFTICSNGASSKKVPARGVARDACRKDER